MVGTWGPRAKSAGGAKETFVIDLYPEIYCFQRGWVAFGPENITGALVARLSFGLPMRQPATNKCLWQAGMAV
jgi:hypothetical protein